MGITRIANVTGLDTIGIPVVVVCRPNSRNLAVSQGKGPTLDAARASGLMEAVEFYHAERIELPLKLAGYDELRVRHQVVDVRRLPRMATRPFSPRQRVLWIAGRDLNEEQEVWVPYELVHMDYRLPLPSGSGAFLMSSNGLASGNHRLEATSHAICELIERDADSLWKARGKPGQAATRLDLDTVDDPACRDLLDRFERAGIAVAVWDTTADLGVASFRCTIMDREPNPWRLMCANTGMGCHPSRDVALSRSLTEAAQSRLTVISSSRDDVTRNDYDMSRNPDLVDRLRTGFASQVPVRDYRRVPTFESDTIDGDLHWLLERLAGRGFDRVVAVDLTRPELDLPVVRVIVPGLESTHLATGYVRGPRARAAAAGEL